MTIRAALQAAADRGQRLRPIVDRPGLCHVVCEACGYGTGEGREVVIEKYAREPFGCITDHEGAK